MLTRSTRHRLATASYRLATVPIWQNTLRPTQLPLHHRPPLLPAHGRQQRRVCAPTLERVQPSYRSACPRIASSAIGTIGLRSCQVNGAERASACTFSDWGRLVTFATCCAHIWIYLYDSVETKLARKKCVFLCGLEENRINSDSTCFYTNIKCSLKSLV